MNEFSFALGNSILCSDDYLSHHGILGMHWGKRNGPPYPLGSDDHSSEQKAAARKAGIKVGGSSGKGSIENLYSSSSSSRVDTSSKEQPETPEEHEAKRKAALKSGNKKLIKKYASESTYNELNEAVNRALLLKKLDDIPSGKTSNIEKMFSKIDSLSKVTSSVATITTSSLLVYNAVAKIHNSNSESKWPVITVKSDKSAKHSFSCRNEFYSNLDVNPYDYLSHHGILGMK